MRFLLPVLLANFVVGCAHAPVPQAGRSGVLSVSEGSTEVLLRYAPEDEEIAQQVRRALQRALPVASRWGALPSTVTVVIHRTHEALEAAARRPAQPWLRAWARRDSIEVQSPRSWSRGGATDAELAQLLAHELTHCALSQALGSAARASRTVPLWFWEGMATTNAGEQFPAARPGVAGPLTVDAALHDATSPRAYPLADRAFRSLLRRYGEGRIHELVARVRAGVEFPDAFHEMTGIRLDAFERDLERDVGQERTRG